MLNLSPGSARLIDRLSHRHSVWTSNTPGIVLLGAAGLTLAVLYGRHRRRRQLGLTGHRWRAATGVAGALALTVLATAAFVNAYAGYLPTTAALTQAVGFPAAGQTAKGSGQVREVFIPDPGLGVPGGSTYIYTPPGYNPAAHRRYPVLYMIHGSPGNSADWFQAGGAAIVLDTLINARAIAPVLLVAPSANAGFLSDTECLNAVGGRQLETYLTRDVVGYVDQHFATAANWQHRGIGGMSSGGFCALNVGLKHQNVFGTVLAFEPYGDPGVRALPLLNFNRALLAANSPRTYLPSLRFQHPMSFFLDVGGLSGGSIRQVRSLGRELRLRQQNVEFRVEPGQAHTWTEAAAGLPYALAFASKVIGSSQV